MKNIAAKIRELAPQVVALQEVWLGSEASELARKLAPEWTPIYVPRMFDAPRGGLVVFLRKSDRCDIRGDVRFDPFTISAPAWRIWEGDGLGGKGILSLRVQCGQHAITVVDTHLQSQYPGLAYHSIRQSQLDQLQSFVSGLDKASFLLIAGDFNTDAHEPLYSDLANIGIDTTSAARQRCACGTTVEMAGIAPQWIDYVLARPPGGWSVSSAVTLITNRTRDNPYSDHEGVFAHIAFTHQAP